MAPILLTLTAAFAILTWKDLHAGLLLLVAVLPSYLLRTDILGVPTTLLEMLVMTFLIVWSVKRKAWSLSTRCFTSHVSLFTILIFLLLFAATFAIFIAPDRLAALGVWKAYFVEPLLLYFVIRYELGTMDFMNANRSPLHFTSIKMFQALGVSAIVLSSIAIVQWFTGAGIPIPWDFQRRVTSVFDYPNALGLFLGPIVVIAVASWKESKRFWTSVAILSCIAIVLAQSEAAIVSVIATLLIAGLLNKKTRVVSLSLLALLTLLTLLTPSLLQKLTLQDYSGQVRLSQWNETMDMLGDHWLFGAGLSGYPTVFEPYHQATHIEIFQYPHNIILNIWVELGVLGLVAFLLLAWQVLNVSHSTFHAPQSLALLALVQMTIHGLVDVPFFKNDLAILTWILLAILVSYAGSQTPSKTS